MNKIIALALIAFLAVPAVAYADCGVCGVGSAKKGEIINDTCPVMGGSVDKDTPYSTVYEGKKIGFCCASCVGKFKENPEAYMKKLGKECMIECPECGAKIDVKKECERIGKACPITQKTE